MIIGPKSEHGFGAKVNILNYSGQSPLYCAAREGDIDTIKTLVECGKANVDLNGGELVKEDDEEEEFDSVEEKYFMEAFKNTMTPL